VAEVGAVFHPDPPVSIVIGPAVITPEIIGTVAVAIELPAVIVRRQLPVPVKPAVGFT
jgi:hypothetical protein